MQQFPTPTPPRNTLIESISWIVLLLFLVVAIVNAFYYFNGRFIKLSEGISTPEVQLSDSIRNGLDRYKQKTDILTGLENHSNLEKAAAIQASEKATLTSQKRHEKKLPHTLGPVVADTTIERLQRQLTEYALPR